MNLKKISISVISALFFGTSVAMAAGIPENVTGLKGTAVDASSISLTWKAAKDADGGVVKNYRIYYGKVSVLEAGSGDYEKQVDTPDNTNSFTVAELTPNTKYYFSATAISSDNKESAEYSLEASATTKKEEAAPAAPGADVVAPTVASVSAPDKKHVKIVFSEAVQLPLVSPEASFGIVEQINPANELTLTSAVVDPADTTKKTVLLETSDQTPNVNYIVTAGVAVKDLAGNPIVSGSTDSGLFLGSSVEPAKAGEPVAPATTAVDCAKDLACFLTHFTDCSPATVNHITESSGNEEVLEIIGAEETNCKFKSTAIKGPTPAFAGKTMECTAPMKSYATADELNSVVEIKKCTGELAALINAESGADTTPPENITNLLLSFKKELEKYTVMLSWTPSLNTAKDLVDQLLYMSMDKGKNFDAGKPLGALVAKTDVASLEGGKEYTFKITTKDAAGNESTGVVKSIRLPQTGPALGLILLGSLGVAKRLLKRKKNEEI